MGTWDVRVLSISFSTKDDETVIELYGKTRDRESVTILVRGFRHYFFIVEPHPAVREGIAKETGVIETSDDRLLVKGEWKDVMKVVVDQPWRLRNLTDILKKRHCSLLGADITYQKRFIYDMDMGSCIRITGRTVDSEYRTDLTVEFESFENIESFDPGLKILSFDIENSIRHGTLYTICSVISDPDGIRECEAAVGTEQEILETFTDIITEEDPDIITGYNIDNYDITKIVERAKTNKLDATLTWGRDSSLPKSHDSNIRGRSKVFWRVQGRLVIDAWWAAKQERMLKQETLNAVSLQILDEQKLDVDAKYIDEEWAKDSAKVVKYCYKDAELALKILLAVGHIRKKMDLAAVAKLPVADVLTSGTSTLVDSMLIRVADKEKIGVPQTGKMTRTDQIEGGYVHNITAGLYHWVCVLDFKSMYPSLIIAKNICFTTLSPDGEIEAPNGVRYMSKDRRVGLLPRILEGLMKERDSIKARMKKTEDPVEKDYLNGLQAAVKVVMNTFYGVFASSFYRFTDKQIGSSITSFARHTVKTIIEELTEAEYKVIYSDTDSIFVGSPYNGLEKTVEFGTMLAERYSKDGGTLEFEKIMEPLFSHGKKKRYVGRIVWPEKSDELYIRGYDTQRSDSFDLQSDTLKALFERILDGETDDAVAMVRETIKNVQLGKVPAEKLVISKGCKGLEAYEDPDRMTSVQAAKKMIEMGEEFIPGMKVSWIVTDSSVAPQVVEPYISGREFPSEPDYKYYAERIASSASKITEVFGWNEKDLMRGSQQSTLFDGGFEKDQPAQKQHAEPPKQPAKPKIKSLDFF